MTLDVGGIPITIKYVERLTNEGEACVGLYDPLTRTISIDSGSDPKVQDAALFQEIGHAVYDVFGCSYSFKGFVKSNRAGAFEEALVHSFMACIYNTLIRNGMYKKPQ